MKSKKHHFIFAALALAMSAPAIAQETSTMKVRITVDGKAIEATLLDNATARDFASLLPLTLTLEDYNSTHGWRPCGRRSRTRRHRVLRAVGKPRDLLQRLRLLEGSHQARAD